MEAAAAIGMQTPGTAAAAVPRSSATRTGDDFRGGVLPSRRSLAEVSA